MLLKCCTQYVSKFGILSSGTRLEKVSFHSNPKEGHKHVSPLSRTYAWVFVLNCNSASIKFCQFLFGFVFCKFYSHSCFMHCFHYLEGFLGGSDGKGSACNAVDLGLIPGSGKSPREGNGYPFQYSCLENYRDRGAWRATVCGVV